MIWLAVATTCACFAFAVLGYRIGQYDITVAGTMVGVAYVALALRFRRSRVPSPSDSRTNNND